LRDVVGGAQRKKGNVSIYADAAGCGCAFIGNDAAYQQYQQIRKDDAVLRQRLKLGDFLRGVRLAF
jgi:hypothetical protein